MQRVALINGENINQDYDFSKILESLATPWVVKWLEVQTGKVTAWYGFIEVERNGTSFFVLFENTENLTIDTSGTKKVFIEINRSNINDWSSNNSDWTGIWEIKTASSYPTSNFIKLASISWWVITDDRVFIDLRTELNVTKQWNTFNWANQLVKLNNEGKLPELDGSNLTGIGVDISTKIEQFSFTNLQYQHTEITETLTIPHSFWATPKEICAIGEAHQMITSWFYSNGINKWQAFRLNQICYWWDFLVYFHDTYSRYLSISIVSVTDTDIIVNIKRKNITQYTDIYKVNFKFLK